LFRRQP